MLEKKRIRSFSFQIPLYPKKRHLFELEQSEVDYKETGPRKV
jgi:hypothetical protein